MSKTYRMEVLGFLHSSPEKILSITRHRSNEGSSYEVIFIVGDL